MKELSDDQLLNQAADIANDTGIDDAELYLSKNGFDSFGIESISCGDDELEYLNVGDPYSATIGRVSYGFWQPIGGWGDWLESAEHIYNVENDTIRCGYCGEFTPLTNPDNWHETICGSCGRFVDSGEMPVKIGEDEFGDAIYGRGDDVE